MKAIAYKFYRDSGNEKGNIVYSRKKSQGRQPSRDSDTH